MLSRKTHLAASLLLVLSVISNLLLITAHGAAPAQAYSPAAAQNFSPPLGYQDGVSYGPRINYSNGRLIEDSEYGVFNPDMQGSTCFGLDWGSIYHAGEDWYRKDGKSTAQAEVDAVTDGVVRYIAYNFPGAVMLIEHRLTPGGQQKIYALYGHLDPNSVLVSVNQNVVRGQKLGAILLQYYDGRYTPYHDDSHLHFEMRYFYDASSIYPNYPYCNGYLPGRGYSYPQHPDDFPPSQPEHYTNPIVLIQNRESLYLPLVSKPEAFCSTELDLVSNGGFEGGSAGWVELKQAGNPIITNIQLPAPAYNGSWAAWLGGRDNASERFYQNFKVIPGMAGATLSYYAWIGTDEAPPGAYDQLYVRLRDTDDAIIQQLDYLDNNSAGQGWIHRTMTLPDLSSRMGQTLRLSFDGTTDESSVTSFLIDNVGLTAVCSGLK